MDAISTSNIDANWMKHLEKQFTQPYMQQLTNFLIQEQQAGKSILPPTEQRFNALKSTPLNKVKVVILGQDPYPTAGHAHGLSFSVQADVKPLPRSLKNIYKELYTDVGIDNQHTGCLQAWAEQGVLLLNTVLTVEEGQAGSHQKKGWETLTDAIIATVSAEAKPSVFILWGAHAQKKSSLIDKERHLMLKSSHPSPLSARRGFFGSQPFSKANSFLQANGRDTINWIL